MEHYYLVHMFFKVSFILKVIFAITCLVCFIMMIFAVDDISEEDHDKVIKGFLISVGVLILMFIFVPDETSELKREYIKEKQIRDNLYKQQEYKNES